MASGKQYQVIVILPPRAAWRTVRALDTACNIRRFARRVAAEEPETDAPHWVSPTGPVELVRELRDRLPDEAILFLSFVVASGGGLLELRRVPEAELGTISAGLDTVLQIDDRMREILHGSLPLTEPLGLAFPEGETGDRVRGAIASLVAADISPDGLLVATTDRAATGVWRAGTGEQLLAVRSGGHDVSFVLDGTALHIAHPEYREIIDVSTGRLMAEVPSGGDVSPNGRLLAVADEGGIAVRDLRQGHELWRTEGTYCAWGGNGRLFVSGPERSGSAGWTVVHESWSGERLVRIPGHRPYPAPDGASVVTISSDGCLVWDARTGRFRQRLPAVPMENAPWQPQSPVIAYDPAVPAAVVQESSGEYLVFDPSSGTERFRLHGRAVDLFSRAGLVLAQGFAYDAVTGEERYRFGRGQAVSDPTGRAIAVRAVPDLAAMRRLEQLYSGTPTSTTRVLNALSGRMRVEVAGTPLRFDSSGSKLVTALDDGRAALWDTGSGRHIDSMGDIRVLSWFYPVIGPPGGPEGPEGTGTPAVGREPPDTSEPPVSAVQRYVDVAGPEAVEPLVPFKISVALLREPPEDIPNAPPVTVMPTEDSRGRSTGQPPITVTIYTSGTFEVLSDRRVDLRVPPDSDPIPAVFRLRSAPGMSGPLEMTIALWQGRETVGQVRFIVNVGEYLTEPKLVHRSLILPPPPVGQVPAPDVLIRVTRSYYDGRDTLHYSYEWCAQAWPRVEAGRLPLLTTADKWFSEYLQELSQAAWSASAGQIPGREPRDFEIIGENLYDALFTPELRAFYLKFARQTRTLLIQTDEPWIPWELVKPWGRGAGGDFLCAQYEMSRWYVNPRGNARLPQGELVVREIASVLPRSDLTAVYREARYVDGLPNRWSVSLRRPPARRRDDVLAVLTGGCSQLLHFAAHGALRRSQSGIAAIELEDGLLRAEDIVGNQIADGLESATPLVFMNACHSARQVTSLAFPDGWVERCIDMGCRAFLGANWEVDDQLAAQFAMEVYERLVSGLPLARAVREARQVLRAHDPANPTWLSYALYAHPDMTLRTASTEAT